MRKHLWLARKPPAQLKLQHATNRVVEGVARTGEVSPKGTVTHIEDWEGRIAAEVNRPTIRYIKTPDGTIRPMTFDELVQRGYFILGKGPR